VCLLGLLQFLRDNEKVFKDGEISRLIMQLHVNDYKVTSKKFEKTRGTFISRQRLGETTPEW